MSFILNQVSDMVKKSVSMEILPARKNTHPVVVTDATNSITSGWSLTYHTMRSIYNENDVFIPRQRFSEVVIKNADQIISDVGAVYGQFKQQQQQVAQQNQQLNMQTYQPNEKIWYTVIQKQNRVDVILTITDDHSPFHMLQVTFAVLENGDQNRHPIYGYDYCMNKDTNEWRDSRNAQMLPSQRIVIRTRREGTDRNAPLTAKVSGQALNDNMVQINEDQTDLDHVRHMSNDRRMLAGIYESAIIDQVKEFALNNIPQNQNQYQDFGNIGNAGDWLVNSTIQSQPTTNQQSSQQIQQSFGNSINQTSNVNEQPQGNPFQQQNQQSSQNIPISDKPVPF